MSIKSSFPSCRKKATKRTEVDGIEATVDLIFNTDSKVTEQNIKETITNCKECEMEFTGKLNTTIYLIVILF